MARTDPELLAFLETLARRATAGDRLPPIRDLMRRFGVSQARVEQALGHLKSQGLIESHVGRGTYFRGSARAPVAGHPEQGRAVRSASEPAPGGQLRGARGTSEDRPGGARSVLLLRRSISITRGRLLIDGLHRRLTTEGHRVLELAYTDTDHALAVLRGLPHFDACVVQSTFRILPIELLAALKGLSRVLAVDGMALVGADVEAVGTEWGEPLATAVELLRAQHHRRIAFVSTSHPFLATALARRRLASLGRTLPELDLLEIDVPELPDGDYAAAVIRRLSAMRVSAPLPFTGMVVWGIEDGSSFRQQLVAAGLAVPEQLSVVLLGRTDLANEHADFFHTVGTTVADQVTALHEALTRRWAERDANHEVRLTPVTVRLGASVAEAPPPPPLSAGRAREPRSRR